MTDAYGTLYLTAPCGLVTTTVDGIVTTANDTMLTWLGLDRDSFVGSSLRSHLDPAGTLFYETRYVPLLHLEGAVDEIAITFVASDGSRLPALVNSRLREAETGQYVHLAVFDARVRQQYEREMLEARRLAEMSEVRVSAMQSLTSDLTLSLTEEEVCAALVRSAGSAFAATHTGVFLLRDDLGLELVAGTNPVEGIIPTRAPVGDENPRASDIALNRDEVITITAENDDPRFERIATALRSVRLESVSVIPMLRDGQPLGVLACFFARGRERNSTFSDLQAALARLTAQALVRVRLQGELARLALHDQLTGLANRTLIQDTVDRAVVAADEYERPMAVVFLDLDGFKGINDQLGHAAGDSVLRQVAGRIRGGVRAEDAVGRYGGDEFVVICRDADAAEARGIAERVRALISEPLDDIPASMRVSASVGVAVYTPSEFPAPSNDQMLRLADDAMYLSKAAGKDTVSFLHR